MLEVISSRIKQLREEKNLTVRELAENLNISKSTLSGWENENRKPDYKAIISLSNYFDVSSDYLLGLTDDRYDFAHKNTFEEIVYIRICDLVSKIDISNLKEQDENLINKYTSSPTTPVYEELCRLSEILNTSVPWIIGMVDTPEKEYYYTDPMNDDWGVKYIKEEIVDYMSEPKKPIYHYAKLKNTELSERVNIAYNVLISLGIDELLGKSINQYSTSELLKYYSIIINHLKDTIRLFNFDKLIEEEINSTNKKNDELYLFDFFVNNKIVSIDDIKNGYQFEKYLAYLLALNNFTVYTNNNEKIFEGPGMTAIKNNNKYIIECKYIDFQNNPKDSNNILDLLISSQFMGLPINNVKYIYAINIKFSDLIKYNSKLKNKVISDWVIVWDKEDIQTLEINAK